MDAPGQAKGLTKVGQGLPKGVAHRCSRPGQGGLAHGCRRPGQRVARGLTKGPKGLAKALARVWPRVASMDAPGWAKGSGKGLTAGRGVGQGIGHGLAEECPREGMPQVRRRVRQVAFLTGIPAFQ